MKKIYPINVAGIKNIGIEEWLKDFYIPVTGKEFQAIYDNVFACFLEVLRQYNNDVVYWVAISNIKIPSSISQWISQVLRLIRLKERGYGYIVGKEKVRIPNDVSIYEYESLDNINVIGKIISGLSIQKRIKNILSTIKYNSLPPVFADINFLNNISSPVFFIGYRSQQEVVAYCNQNKISPIQLHPLLFANNSHAKVNKDPELNNVHEFVCHLFTLLEKQFPEINSRVLGLLKNEIDECFIYSLLLFRQNINAFVKIKPTKLLATGLGNAVHSNFCASWRYAGGDVVGFIHGNNFAYGYTPKISINILSLVNHFVTISAGYKEVLQKVAGDFSYGLRMGNITFVKQSYNKRLFAKLQKEKSVSRIKNIMLVGCPIRDVYSSFFSNYYSHTQFDLEIRLVKLLRSSGYYVIYKPHPIMLNDVEGVYSEYANEVIRPRFEEVYDKADCIMFGNYATTTFAFSMHTVKPIVFFTVKGDYWHPRTFELIKKRCSVVEAEVADGRIVFNKQDVLDAVESSIENIDYEILHELAF